MKEGHDDFCWDVEKTGFFSSLNKWFRATTPCLASTAIPTEPQVALMAFSYRNNFPSTLTIAGDRISLASPEQVLQFSSNCSRCCLRVDEQKTANSLQGVEIERIDKSKAGILNEQSIHLGILGLAVRLPTILLSPRASRS